jgi:hypothetical protein
MDASDIELVWEYAVRKSERAFAALVTRHVEWINRNGQTLEPSVMKQALIEQLGLELISARRPMEMLIVERIR